MVNFWPYDHLKGKRNKMLPFQSSSSDVDKQDNHKVETNKLHSNIPLRLSVVYYF